MSTKLGIAPNKTFSGDFEIIKSLLKRCENFAFSRFSDGEVYMLQNKEIILSQYGAKVGQILLPGNYVDEDRKHFDPQSHGFYRDRLQEALEFSAPNYYKGLSCRCCISDGDDNFQWQLDIAGDSDENLTWANLLINSNYLRFLDEIVPLLTSKIIMILSKNAIIKDWSLPFRPVKDFRVGPNCIINDYPLIEDILSYIRDNEIENHIFLCSASSLSNMIIHQCYEQFPNNTYIDIGSSLNPFIPGITSRRAYMNQISSGINMKECIW